MKRLKQLVETGTDQEILTYIKTEFKFNEYLKIAEDVEKLKSSYLELQIQGIERQKRLLNLIDELNGLGQ